MLKDGKVKKPLIKRMIVLPWEEKIWKCQSVPWRMLKVPEITSSVNTEHNGNHDESVKYITKLNISNT